ncbi:mycothiol synthase [Pseudonocardia humida]|uniref:Mycothiol acetyltransferase n=1 Tax=Pseudonocardia humida TaxID=2800819 RepID=A0ABT1A8D9_9PSEU|nr:mycothiol synthase [Pseudonocardia humida]
MDAAAIDDVRAFAAAVAAADGTAPLSDDALLHLDGPGTAQLLALTPAGELAGFAHLDLSPDPAEPASGELAVHPGHRRSGLGARIVEEVLAKVGGPVRVWAHGEHPGAVALAARFGFRRARELWQLRRDLTEPLPEPVLPEGVRLRSFVVGADEAEFLRVNNAAFHWHPEQGGWDLSQIRLREAEPWFDAEGFLLAVDADDRLLGYHWTKIHPAERDEDPIGEVYVVGVDPQEQGRRLGGALTAAGLAYLRERGMTRVMLYVEADNAAAVRVYEKLGFTRWSTDVSYAR